MSAIRFSGLVLLQYFLLLLPAGVSGAEFTDTDACPAEYRIDAQFDNGAAWRMCWSSAPRENIVLSAGSYRPPQGEFFPVFSNLGLAQLHVSYDDSNIVYNDVTQFGLGGELVKTLSDIDCVQGKLQRIGGVPRMCVAVSDGIDQYQSLRGTIHSQSLTVFSVSMVGAYSYLVTWKFFADGSIQPSIGAAGALQRSSDNPQSPHGRRLDGINDKSWLSHTHNYYWKLDFDLGESAFDDEVSEIAFVTDADGRRSRTTLPFAFEVAREINPQQMTSWQISDGDALVQDNPAYLIAPVNYGHKLVDLLNEPYTQYDFFATRQKDCERFASENSNYYPQCAADLLRFVDEEKLTGADVVLWHRISFHHVPRNEDRYVMHSHWDGFTIEARNLSKPVPAAASELSATTLAAIEAADLAEDPALPRNSERSAESGGVGSVYPMSGICAVLDTILLIWVLCGFAGPAARRLLSGAKC